MPGLRFVSVSAARGVPAMGQAGFRELRRSRELHSLLHRLPERLPPRRPVCSQCPRTRRAERVQSLPGAEHPGISAVAEAFVQGLARNLAFFLAKCGWKVREAKCEFATLRAVLQRLRARGRQRPSGAVRLQRRRRHGPPWLSLGFGHFVPPLWL